MNGSLAARYESGVMDRVAIQSIWRFTKAGTSVGRALMAVRLMTTWPVKPQPLIVGEQTRTSTKSNPRDLRISTIVP
jgi:hypothetical protein